MRAMAALERKASKAKHLVTRLQLARCWGQIAGEVDMYGEVMPGTY